METTAPVADVRACPSCGRAVPAHAAAGLCAQCLAESLLGETPPPDGAQFLGGYELLEVIGRGGMGTVWRARQAGIPDATREVALKAVAAARALHPGVERRFRAEIGVVLRLEHPGIVPVYDAGVADGQLFFTMKLLTGGTLQEQPRKSPQVIAQTMVRVARAVAYAHERGVLHRDLKPANILLDEHGEPFVADFGLARLLDTSPGSEALTKSRDIVGTPAFMAPEQAAGGGALLTTAVDVYGLGGVLYFLLSGRAPAEGSSHAEILRAVAERDPVRPSSLHDSVPRDLEIIAMKCLEKKPSARYTGAGELADDLDRWLRGEPIRARPPTARERLRAWARRHRVQAALWPLVICFLAAGSIMVWRHNVALTRERDAATLATERAEASEQHAGQELYASALSLAWRAWAEHDHLRATAYLDSARPELRDFSWQALRAELDIALSDPVCLQVLRDVPGPPRKLAWAPAARRLFLAGNDRLLWCDPGDGRTRPEFHEVLTEAGLLEKAREGQEGLMQQLLETSVPPPWPDEWGSNGPPEQADAAGRVWAATLGLKGWAPKLQARSRARLIGKQPGMAVSADGQHLVLAPENGFARIWNLSGTTPEREAMLPLHAGAVTISSDGTRVAASLHRGEVSWKRDAGPVCLWQRGAAPAHPTSLPGSWLAAVLSPDGQRVVLAGDHWEVALMDFTTGQRLAPKWYISDGVGAMTFSPDSGLLAVSRSGHRDVWGYSVPAQPGDTLQATDALPPMPAVITDLAFSSDAKLLACASADSSLRVAPSLEATMVLTGHTAPLISVVFTGKQSLVSASEDGTVRFWSVATPPGSYVPSLPSPDKQATAMQAWSPDERWFSWPVRGREVHLADLHSGRTVTFTTAAAGEDVLLCGWTDEGRQAVLIVMPAKENARLELHRMGEDGRSAGLARTIPLPFTAAEIHAPMSVSPDGRWWASSSHSARAWFVDLKAAIPEVFSIPSYHGDHYAWSPDSTKLATSMLNFINVLSPQERRETGGYQPADEKASIPDFAWLPDSRTLLAASGHDLLRIDPVSQSITGRLTGLRFPITAVAVSPDGRTVLTIADRLAFWHLPTGRLLGDFPSASTLLVFSRSGKQVLTETGSGNRLRLWGTPALAGAGK